MRRKFLLVSIGGRAEGLACTDPEERTPIGASRNFREVMVVHYLSIHDLVDCVPLTERKVRLLFQASEV